MVLVMIVGQTEVHVGNFSLGEVLRVPCLLTHTDIYFFGYSQQRWGTLISVSLVYTKMGGYSGKMHFLVHYE